MWTGEFTFHFHREFRLNLSYHSGVYTLANIAGDVYNKRGEKGYFRTSRGMLSIEIVKDLYRLR